MALESVCFILYSGLFTYSWYILCRSEKTTSSSNLKSLNSNIFYLLLIALVNHGYLCYLHIDGGNKTNLGLFNIFCMTSWIAMILVTWNLFKHQAESLLLVSLPLAMLSIIGVAFFTGDSPLLNETKWVNLLHIFSGIAAISLLLLSTLQASLVLYLDRSLRRSPGHISPLLNSLESMKRYLIHLLTTGFVLMSISLLLVFLLPMGLKNDQALHKIVLTSASWLVLAVLIFGRLIRGWRGVFTAKLSIFATFLLFLGYFGSKFVLEFILH